MIKASADFFSRIVQRWLPDAFVIAIILTLVVFLSGIVFQDQSISSMADYWGNGIWNLLSFSMQMVLILVLGTVLATSKPVKTILTSIAKLAKTPYQGIVLVTLVSMSALWINWGFGLVIGALIAREVASHVACGERVPARSRRRSHIQAGGEHESRRAFDSEIHDALRQLS